MVTMEPTTDPRRYLTARLLAHLADHSHGMVAVRAAGRVAGLTAPELSGPRLDTVVRCLTPTAPRREVAA